MPYNFSRCDCGNLEGAIYPEGTRTDIWSGVQLEKQTMSNATMKTLFSLIVTVFFLMTSAAAQAGLQEGIDAYGKGNYPAALKEFKPLAAKGNAAAQSILGFMYANGQDVPQDYNKAVKWYRKAAAQGDADAQTFLGIMYGKGQGVPQDYGKAVEWYRKAAEQGFADAQSNLGMMYANGQGVPQDYGKAVEWCRKAAEQGFAPAQFNLGVMYANGQGVPLDMVEAHKWFSLAEAVVGEGAVNNRKLVEADMTPQQVEEAQKLSREWAEKHK